MNELTLGDYLRCLPGVTFTGPPGNPADVRLRGMDQGYTQILIDGEPVATGTKERQLQVDRMSLDMVERVEIIRAPTADLSNEGLMGTINIVLRDIPGKQIRNARLVAGRIFGEKADLDTWNLSGQVGDGSGDVRWLLNASVGSNLSYSSGYTREANPDTEQTQRARTQLDLYAVKKLDRALSLRMSIDNVTREERGDDSLEYSGGLLSRREIDRADGVRIVNLSLEGKW